MHILTEVVLLKHDQDNNGNRETAALYRQFRNVLLKPNDNKFNFTSAYNSSSGHDDFYFLTFNRNK